MENDEKIQGELFDFPSPETDEFPLFSKNYKKQQDTIDKPIDYVGRKAIELRPLDFLQFFSEFQNLSPEERDKIKILDANRTLELYLKKEADSLSLIIETSIKKLKDTVFHIEVQTSYDETIDERILDYNFLIKRKTKKKKVKTLLINLDPNTKSQQLGNNNFGTVRIKYEVKNLWELSYEEIKQKGLLGLLPFTPYLKGSGQPEILEASKIMQEQIDSPTERTEMIFMLAILAGRKYNTVGFKLLSPLIATMNIEFLRDDPTAQYLFRQMYPDEIANARTEGVKEATEDFTRRLDSKIADAEARGVKKATEDFIRRLDGLLSKEQMKQVFGENALASQK
jgi:preprotein translocase subunit SecB